MHPYILKHHTHTTVLQLSDAVWDNPGENVPEETFTHSDVVISHPLSATVGTHTQHTTVLWLCGICPGKPG